jgi:hypothetical protein
MDTTMDAMSSALTGMHRAEQHLDAAASQLAQSSVPGSDGDPVTAMVALATAPIEMAASVKVARAASDMIGTLLDTFA